MKYYIGTTLNKNKTRVILEARRNKDLLSCEIYDYFGERLTTKKNLNKTKNQFLAYLKTWKPDLYGNCKTIIVS